MDMKIRTDQVGSLIRPQALLAARKAHKDGKITRDDLIHAEQEGIRDALQMQADAGVEIFSDGELRRDSWQTNLSQNIDGFVEKYPIRVYKKADGTTENVQMHSKAVAGKLRPRNRLAEEDARFLLANAPGPFKITMPSPSYLAHNSFDPKVSPPAYKDARELQTDAIAIIRDEAAALVKDGCSYIQLDEGFVPYTNEHYLEDLRAKGLDIEQELGRDIAADNECYDAVKGDGVIRAMHLCRGNRVSFAGGVGGYDWLAERLFDKLRVDRFLLEYDTDRAGGFEPLRFLPKGKIAVLGLVTTKQEKLETQDVLLKRLEEATKYCDIDQLALSPQCGFGVPNEQGGHISADMQRRKLEMVADIAQKVWS
jgi:5-methyltetrahydropteroyltriglutamate--homocysteine methyltransferase